jgi:uncharacterized membrane protein SirB2
MNPETIVHLYPLALLARIGFIVASFSLFAARGLGVLTRQSWPMHQAWRGLRVWIDVGLLSAGRTLWYLMQFNPWHDRWLGAKLLLVYIGLGTYALKRAPTRATEAAFFFAALSCVASMASIALRHNPLGW